MPNIGALWAEMRGGGGWSSGFCGKNHKVPGYFLQVGGWVGRCLLWKFPFFRKYPLKEDKVFPESTRPPPPKQIISRFQESGRNFTCTERQVKNYISLYFYDERTDEVYYKSTDLTTGHRICITRERLVAEVRRSLEVRQGGSHNYRPCAWHDCHCAGSR